MTATIGFNHLFIEPGPLTGPGYYTMQVLENILLLPPEQRAPFRFKVFVQRGTEHHYSATAQELIVAVPAAGGRYARVIWEQLLLPLRTKREGVDLLFSPGFVSPMFGAPILTAAIPDMYYRVVPDLVERFQRQYWRVMIPLTSRVCDLLLTISESSGRDIERYLPAARGKVVVTPLASRFPAMKDGSQEPPRSPPYILMVSNLTPNKNVTRVVEALANLRREGRDIEFVHIGVDLNGELGRAIACFGLDNHVRSLGKVDDATLIATARSSLCMVVPSLYEGFGMPAIEAQALGAPLVCSDRSSLPEVASGAALMFNPEDTAALAACIARIMDEPGLRETLREKGFENVQRFSWQRTAQSTLNAFQQILSTRGLIGAKSQR